MTNPFESLMSQLISQSPKDSEFKAIKEKLHQALEYHQNANDMLSIWLSRGAPEDLVMALKRQIEDDLRGMGNEILTLACDLHGLEADPSNHGTLALLLLKRIVGDRPKPRSKWTPDEVFKLEAAFEQAWQAGAKTDIEAWEQVAKDPYWQRMCSDARHGDTDRHQTHPGEINKLAKTLRRQHLKSVSKMSQYAREFQQMLNAMRTSEDK